MQSHASASPILSRIQPVRLRVPGSPAAAVSRRASLHRGAQRRVHRGGVRRSPQPCHAAENDSEEQVVIEADTFDEAVLKIASQLIAASKLAKSLMMKEMEAEAQTNGDDHSMELLGDMGIGRIMVGFAGPPGSGKSTMANGVVNAINAAAGDGTAAVLPMDGFHLYKSELAAMEDPEEARARRGAHWTFDAAAFVECVKKVRAQAGDVGAPTYDHGTGDPKEDGVIITQSTSIIVVEGNYLLLDLPPWSELYNLMDAMFYVDVDIDLAMERVYARHVSTGKEPKVAAWRCDYNDRPNAELIESTKPRADTIIPNSLPM